MPRTVAHARWWPHVKGVDPKPGMRGWLTDSGSLTNKLTARCTQFRVQLLRQRRGMCLADEWQPVGLPRRRRVQERDVLLLCDGEPMVFAHSILPLAATASDWPCFSALGERALGTTLFGDPRVARGSLQYARLRASHPLVRRASAALHGDLSEGPLYARRCLYRRHNGVLLVTEVFLPALAGVRI